MLATTPRLTPEDSARPTPNTSILFFPFRRPTVTHIFVVPMSSPTTIGESVTVVDCAFIRQKVNECFYLFGVCRAPRLPRFYLSDLLIGHLWRSAKRVWHRRLVRRLEKLGPVPLPTFANELSSVL